MPPMAGTKARWHAGAMVLGRYLPLRQRRLGASRCGTGINFSVESAKKAHPQPDCQGDADERGQHIKQREIVHKWSVQ